jgi:tetratricopeptide (TPR) repeat protein
MKGLFFTALAIAAGCAVIVILVSCNKPPDTDTLRLYVRASETYAAGRFMETAEILSKEKKFAPSLLLRAKAEYFDGNFESAEKSCRAALRKRPSSFEAKLFMARIMREKNDRAKTEKLLESLLADNPQDIRTLRLAAELAIEERKFDEASAFLDRAAEFSAESAMVLLDRARLRWIAGRNRDALEDLSRAKAMLPWDTPLLRAISNLENTVKGAM